MASGSLPMRSISIFGSTGSIGVNTLDLIARDPKAYAVEVLTGGRNVELLAQQAKDTEAKCVVTAFADCYKPLKSLLSGAGIEVAAGPDALVEAAGRDVDWTMSAIVGAAGLAPGLCVLERGGTLALANKETLVAAGPLVAATTARTGARLLPVDSEHSAVFQALIGEDIATVERIIITASGGPFRDWPVGKLAKASLQEALNHPNWSMGQRITIDSASMFNKALEIIETKEFFGVRPDQIEVVVHPESLVHALVGFNDGALMAHLGAPDMRHAIGFALNWPMRGPVPVNRLNLASVGKLRFEAPDETRFPALRLAREVMQIGGLSGAAFNAAKETALDGFIAGQIGFMDMAVIVEQTLETIESRSGFFCGHKDAAISLDNVMSMDHMARHVAQEQIESRQQKGRH